MGKFDPFSYWSNALEMTYMMSEAQAVISMRLMGMAGIWSVTPAEDSRMVSEKTQAMNRAGAEAARVMIAGGTPDRVMAAAIKPIRQKTRANAKRLGKRGLKKKG
ncbi:antifreeze protein [uncultured Sulfitobacter sp.]|uniref:antifreeze protein n=1 Tax=uncultured Sulfitobacter sp. TaxID=191468 RepID=UPI00261A40DF|nr:antifreeze protein [uncultured Sulfitobacter sp.]